MIEEYHGAVYYKFMPDTGYLGRELHTYQKSIALQMLSHAFSDFFHVQLKEELLKRAEYGKPYYDSKEKYYFNISHCKNAVVVAAAKKPVGVDVEGPRRVRYRTVEQCCSADEKKYIFGISNPVEGMGENLSKEEMKRFLHLWTLKESYVKMTGEGLRTPIKTVCFDIPQFYKINQNSMRWVDSAKYESYLHIQGDIVMALTMQHVSTETDAKVVWIPYASAEVI